MEITTWNLQKQKGRGGPGSCAQDCGQQAAVGRGHQTAVEAAASTSMELGVR